MIVILFYFLCSLRTFLPSFIGSFSLSFLPFSNLSTLSFDVIKEAKSLREGSTRVRMTLVRWFYRDGFQERFYLDGFHWRQGFTFPKQGWGFNNLQDHINYNRETLSVRFEERWRKRRKEVRPQNILNWKLGEEYYISDIDLSSSRCQKW